MSIHYPILSGEPDFRILDLSYVQFVEPDVVVPRVVRRAEKYMRENAGRSISLQEIADEAGCSERALQNAFKTFRQKTPMAALRDIKLEYARQDIEKCESSITDIAFKWGFSNLGRFSAHYLNKFGEYPRNTARMSSAS